MARPWSVALAVSVAVLLPAGTGADLSHASAFVAPAVARLSSLGSPLSQNKLALPHPTRGRRDPLALRCMAQPGTETKPVDPAWVSGTKTLKATEYYKPLVAGDILESTDQQRGIVVGSYVALAALFVKGCLLLPPMSAAVMVQVVLAIVIGYEFADIGSGVYHWSMDNYGSKNTPVFGTQIEAFQGHHELPWTITYRQVCNNIYKICQATAPFCVGGILIVNNPFVLLWMSTAISFINLSQELHKWSHQGRGETAWWINMLQDYNLIVSRKGHLAHHKPPFEGNYCIVSGHCNPIADKLGLFRGLETIVFSLTGNKPRCETLERPLENVVVDLGIKRASSTLERSGPE